MIAGHLFWDCSGALASLISTFLYIRINRYAWLTTIIASLINGWLYWNKGIYGDTFLECTYLVSALYGWMMWKDTVSLEPVTTKKLLRSQWIVLIAFLLAASACASVLFMYCTNSTVPVTDSLTSVISLTAQWLMSHRFIASWILWLIADLIYLYLYFVKQLPVHILLMVVYVVMAVVGYVQWRRTSTTGVA